MKQTKRPAKQVEATSDVKVVATSVGVSVLDVVFNFVVSLLTGSAVMLSQALQGLSDLITGGILFIGVRRSHRRADTSFQFGYGREIFFWVLLAGIVMFIGTGGASVYFGYQQIAHPDPLESTWLAFVMLTFGFTTNGYAFYLSLRRMREKGEARGRSWWRHLILSSIVETKATFMIDFLGTAATVLGFIALTTYALTGNAQFDGIGSVLIGLVMMMAAVWLVRDVRDLIVGRSVDEDTLEAITDAAMTVKHINDVLDLRTMYLGSERLLVVIEVHVADGLDTDTIEKVTDRVKQAIAMSVPIVHHVQVEVETPD